MYKDLIEASLAAQVLDICRVRLNQLTKEHNLTIHHIRTKKGGHPQRFYLIKQILKLKKKRESKSHLYSS